MRQDLHFGWYLRNLHGVRIVYLRATAHRNNHRTLVTSLHDRHQIAVLRALQLLNRRRILGQHADRVTQIVRVRLHLQRVERDVVQSDIIVRTRQYVHNVHNTFTAVRFRDAERLFATVQHGGMMAEGVLAICGAVLRSVRRRTAVLGQRGVSPVRQRSPKHGNQSEIVENH